MNDLQLYDPLQILPLEINEQIFSLLDPVSLGRCLRVSSLWKIVANEEKLWANCMPECAFGKKQWEMTIGDIGQSPPLAKNIHALLKKSCPFWPNKKVEDTHVLMLIPKTINQEALTIELLERLAKFPKMGKQTYLLFKPDKLMIMHGFKTVKDSFWVLMTKQIIPESNKISFDKQLTLLSDVNKKLDLQYEMPDLTVVMTCLFMKIIFKNEYLLNPTTTHCQETIDNHSLAVGCFFSFGISVVAKAFQPGVAPMLKI